MLSLAARPSEIIPMWCSRCQQDVPAISKTEGGFRCARCGNVSAQPTLPSEPALALGQIPDYGIDLSGHDPATPMPVGPLADWQFDDELQSVERVLRTAAAADGPVAPLASTYRFDPPQLDLLPLQAAEARRQLDLATYQPVAAPRERSSWLAWTIMAAGLMALVCGGVLLGWSVIDKRPQLWTLGLPIAVAGQCGLLLGLLAQLERLWQTGRASQQRLAEVDRRLSDLGAQTVLLGTTHSTASKAFYTHMVDGASPQVLLADVKGQLDMLAVRMGHSSR